MTLIKNNLYKKGKKSVSTTYSMKNPIFGLFNHGLCSEAVLKCSSHAFQDILFNLIKNSLLIPYCVYHIYFPIPSEP